MKISHETPISLFNESLVWNDYQYCLVHLLEEQPKYLEHFEWCRDNGIPVLLDNSIFELGEAFQGEDFAKWIKHLNPDEYIIPDVLENKQGTLDSMYDWLDKYSDLPGKKIGVVQGKTYKEIVECYREVDKFCDKIAISFNYSLYEKMYPHTGRLISWMNGRVMLLEKLLKDGIINENKPHHLLGIALPQEVAFYHNYSWIDSVDTSNPVVHGLLGDLYKPFGLLHKRSIKLFELIEHPVENLNYIRSNVYQFKMFSTGEQYSFDRESLEFTLEDKDKELTYQEKISRSLGSANSYSIDTDKFDPTLLNPIPRSGSRETWGITGQEFVGKDVWHCHEATFLTDKGIPVAGTLKFMYDSTSQYVVESKSMKLYLNSFDMCRMGSDIGKATENYVSQVQGDLSRQLQTDVLAYFHHSGSDRHSTDPFSEYYDLLASIINKQSSFDITDYQGQDRHLTFTPLQSKDSDTQEYRVCTNVLRSRCRHTKQKDTGTAFIYVKTNGAVLEVGSLFEEIVSLRNVEEFHEFCAEKLYTSIIESEYVEECMVALLYSRRGSLDINPVRATSETVLEEVIDFLDVSSYTRKTQGQ